LHGVSVGVPKGVSGGTPVLVSRLRRAGASTLTGTADDAAAVGMFLNGLGVESSDPGRGLAGVDRRTVLAPSFGRVPKAGLPPVAYSLDRIAARARTARDCALMLSALAGHDAGDPCSIDVPVPDYPAALTGDLTGVRVGVARAGDTIGPDLRALGAETVPVELPLSAELAAAHRVILGSELLAGQLPALREGTAEHAAATRAVIDGAASFSAADYVQAQRVRRVGQRAVAELFHDVDLIITPASHIPCWDVLGHPLLVVPMGSGADGPPVGVLISGRPFDEASVLRAGEALQSLAAWQPGKPDDSEPVAT